MTPREGLKQRMCEKEGMEMQLEIQAEPGHGSYSFLPTVLNNKNSRHWCNLVSRS
jgi:hypothetical protein